MADNIVKGTKKLTSANSLVNAMDFMMRQRVHEIVNTAEIVSINSADSQGAESVGGKAIATPMVAQTDGFNNALPVTDLPPLPVWRPQAGKAAILMEPQPGDKAIAVFMKRDSSNLAVGKNEPVQPASFRTFDQADGVLINGVLGETPEIWLMLDPKTGNIELSTKAANVEISCRESGDINIKTGKGKIFIEAIGAPGESELDLKARRITYRCDQTRTLPYDSEEI